MGIVNATPDSFSGDGIATADAAVAQAKQMIEDGADIIDVGGESTRPGATPVSLEEERARVVPIIERLTKEVDVPISVDTYKAEVARQAIRVGASIINDVTAGSDPEMFRVAAESNTYLILMHNRRGMVSNNAALGSRYVAAAYDDLMGDIKKELQERIDGALATGVQKEKIIVDPGIGFGKGIEQNLEIMRRLGELKALGYPILIGASRKSFVGYTLKLPAEERLEGTLATTALAIAKGADIVRVHDIKENDRVRTFADAVVRVR